ncbi:hypothetical protein NVS55_16990 [Myxococcus stipitatus]|uniref:hypothetical protein n=1 Tax=Myxococcus stipitatus TaxID=83455 RepID=UPI003144DD55
MLELEGAPPVSESPTSGVEPPSVLALQGTLSASESLVSGVEHSSVLEPQGTLSTSDSLMSRAELPAVLEPQGTLSASGSLMSGVEQPSVLEPQGTLSASESLMSGVELPLVLEPQGALVASESPMSGTELLSVMDPQGPLASNVLPSSSTEIPSTVGLLGNAPLPGAHAPAALDLLTETEPQEVVPAGGLNSSASGEPLDLGAPVTGRAGEWLPSSVSGSAPEGQGIELQAQSIWTQPSSSVPTSPTRQLSDPDVTEARLPSSVDSLAAQSPQVVMAPPSTEPQVSAEQGDTASLSGGVIELATDPPGEDSFADVIPDGDGLKIELHEAGSHSESLDSLELADPAADDAAAIDASLSPATDDEVRTVIGSEGVSSTLVADSSVFASLQDELAIASEESVAASADVAIALPPVSSDVESSRPESDSAASVPTNQPGTLDLSVSAPETIPAKVTAPQPTEPQPATSTEVPAPPASAQTSPAEASPSVAYLDATESAPGFTESPTPATESWRLGSTAQPSSPVTVSTGEGDTGDSLMLEAAGSMLASHGDPSSRDTTRTREGTATEPLEPESVLPLGDVLPGRTGPKSDVDADATPAPKPPATRRAPIELDELPAADDAPMQLASTWEFVGWQGAEGNGTIGHVAESTWDDRAADLEGAMPRAEPPAGASASDFPLASAWDFIQQPWQPHAREHSEVLTALLAAAGATTATGSEGPAVSADQVLTALDDVSTQGVLGKVLIAYCAGRFQRAFLLGESFGLVRVGHAWGPGSDGPEVAALKVDLDAPSLLVSALGQLGPSSFDAPSSAQDEAIFSALGGPASHLLVVPIRARGRPVAFIVADSGNTPVPSTTLEELTRVSAKASEVYDRLPASGTE